MISILSKAATWSPEQPFGEAFSRVFSSRLCSAQLIWTAVIAYQLDDKTVVRTGAGIFYNSTFMQEYGCSSARNSSIFSTIRTLSSPQPTA